MLIPVGTDAPLYHRPIATVGLIATNVAVFFAIAGVSAIGREWDPWILEFGTGLQPVEWLTSHFVHFGLMHLIGNMIFLLIFGTIVEGKIGWWRFLLLYFSIGIAGDFTIQAAMLGYRGGVAGAGGASLLVYGLIGVAAIWAPENEVDFLLIVLLGRFTKVFSVRIWVIGGLYFALQFVILSLSEFRMGSEAAHLIGAVYGSVAAVAFLLLRWVDCENWDLFSVMRGRHRHGTTHWITSRKTDPPPEPSPLNPTVDLRADQLSLAIDESRFEIARRLFQQLHRSPSVSI